MKAAKEFTSWNCYCQKIQWPPRTISISCGHLCPL